MSLLHQVPELGRLPIHKVLKSYRGAIYIKSRHRHSTWDYSDRYFIFIYLLMSETEKGRNYLLFYLIKRKGDNHFKFTFHT